MSSSDTESSYNSDDSDLNFIPGYTAYENLAQQSESSDSDVDEPYADEPLADEEWLKQYNKDMEDLRKIEQKMKERFDRRNEALEW